MSDETNRISPDATDQIDALCDAFEDSWSLDKRPRIESYLEMVEISVRRPLFRALVPVECELLRRAGAIPQTDDYQRRFPEYRDLLSEIFQQERGVDATRLKLGNYELLEKIGAGGMGAVYKARHTRLNKFVAVKLLPHDYLKNEHAVARFAREMQAVGKLDHPNIVRAMDAGEVDGTHYLVMEFAEGMDLRQLVGRRGPLLIDEAIDFVIQAARAMDYAHRHGLIHRDIKPSNLLYCSKRRDALSEDTNETRDELFGHIKVLDLGLARIDDDAAETECLTATGMVIGTVDYMSIEQAENLRKADNRSDIYSLGCTLFYLLTGQPPYPAETQTLRLIAHRELPIPSLRKAIEQRFGHETQSYSGNTTPVDSSHMSKSAVDLSVLDTIFHKMIAKRPEDRFTTMADVVMALSKVQSSVFPVPAHRSSSVIRPPAEVKRSLDRTAATAVGLLAVAAISAFWFANRRPNEIPQDSVNSTIVPVHTTTPPSSVVTTFEPATRIASQKTGAVTNAKSEGINPERRAAEWVLRIGGTVRLKLADESFRIVSQMRELPDSDFVVSTIDVHGNRRVTDAGIRHNLVGLSGLVTLMLHHTGISDASLEILKDSPTLEYLHLEGTSVTDEGLRALGRMPRIQHLQLNRTRITETGLPALMVHPELSGLDIGSVPASPSAALVLFERTTWRSLALNETWIRPDEIVHLSKQSNLRWLLIYGDLPVSRLRLLSGLPSLIQLELSQHRKWSPELSAGLSSLSNLERLHLNNVSPSVGWKELAAARPWSELVIGYTHVPDELFDGLDQCNSLATLEFIQTTYSRVRLLQFRKDHPIINVVSDTIRARDHELAERFLRMKGIRLQVVDQRGSHLISRLDDLPDTEFELAAVYVDDCPAFDDRILASLTGTHVTALYLTRSAVTDAGLSTLDHLSTLKQLQIPTELMSTFVLRIIGRHPLIEALSLPKCSLDQLRLLASLKLSYLMIDEIEKDSRLETLEFLVRQFPQVTHLSIGRTNLDSAAAKILSKLGHLHTLVWLLPSLSDDVISEFAKYASLTTLELYGGSEDPWPSLTALQRVQKIVIGASSILHHHIERLAELPQLQLLIIDQSPVTPDAITAFSKLRHVGKVRFNRCDLADADWRRIVEALPNSEVLWNGEHRNP